MPIFVDFARVENGQFGIFCPRFRAVGRRCRPSDVAFSGLPPLAPTRYGADGGHFQPSVACCEPAAAAQPSYRKPVDRRLLDRKLYLSCLWPGLPELWWRGRISALPTALAFAAAANFLLVARFVYPEWLASGLVRMGGWVGVAIWLFCVVRSIRDMPLLIHPRRASGQPDRFVEAHQAYLRGQWAEAESLLTDCLAIEHRDPPSLLLLCGVYRHTARLEAAQRLLEEIRLTEAADGWWLEVGAEQARLDRDKTYSHAPAEPPSSTPDSPPDQRPVAQSHATTPPALAPADVSLAEVSQSREIPVLDVVGEIADEIAARSDLKSEPSRAA